MNVSELFDIIHSRRSIRRYQDRPVPGDVLRHLLESACWAPSAHNRQPWRFAVVTDAGKRESLARAMSLRFRQDLTADGLSPEEVDQQVRRSVERIGGAPVVIILFVSMADMDRYPDARRQDAERTMAVQSVALAAQNLLLAAYAEGLGACWMCAPLFCPDVVRHELSLPEDWEAQALLTVGYPAEQRSKDREPLENKSIWY